MKNMSENSSFPVRGIFCGAMLVLACFAAAGEARATAFAEYVRATRAQGFQTDYVPNENTRLVFDFAMEGDVYDPAGNVLFGVPETDYQFTANFGGGPSEDFTLYSWPWKYYGRLGYQAVESMAFSQSVVKGRNTFCFGQGRCDWGNEGRSIHANPTAAEHVFEKTLFVLGKSAENPFKGWDVTLYGFRIFEGDDLVRDYVPAVEDGVAGLFETKTKTFCGSATATPFVSGPATNLAFAVDAIPKQLLCGAAACEPRPVVRPNEDGRRVLVEGTDYVLSWADNKAVGTGTVTVRGIGDCAGRGEASADFEIVAPAYQDAFIATDAAAVDKSVSGVLVTYAFTEAAESVLKVVAHCLLVDARVVGGGGGEVFDRLKRPLDTAASRRLKVGGAGEASHFELDDALLTAAGGDGDASGGVVLRFFNTEGTDLSLLQSVKTTRMQGLQTDYVPRDDTWLAFDFKMGGDAFDPTGNVLFSVPEQVYRFTANFGSAGVESRNVYCWPWKYHQQDGYGQVEWKAFSPETLANRNTFRFGRGRCDWGNEGLDVHANPTAAEHVFEKPLFVLGENASNPFTGWEVELFGFTVYEGDEIVRDYLPIAKNGVAGLFEIESQTFFGSATDTAFVPGPDYGGFVVDAMPKQLLHGTAACEPHPVVRPAEGMPALVEGVDYTLAWSRNTAAGTGVVTVRGINAYAGRWDSTAGFEIVVPAYLDDYVATDAKGVVRIKSSKYMTYVFTNAEECVLKVETSQPLVDLLAVGGGGGGGCGMDNNYSGGVVGGGGGGGGGVVWLEVGVAQDTGAYRRLKVGGGGGGSKKGFDAGFPGGDSVVELDGGLVTAYGGGGGASRVTGLPDQTAPRGSAGGAANKSEAVGAFTEGQGCRGGKSHGTLTGGGGGGATGAGGDGTTDDENDRLGGDGGDGLLCAITGASHCYGSGGGGSGYVKAGSGGRESGGDGGLYHDAGADGVDGLGGGGGGGGYQAFGGAGGSGIVVLRFARAKKGTAVVVF